MDESNLDELTSLMENSALTPDNIAGEHPRFSKYKNVRRAEELQQKRRQEFIEHQKEARFNYSNHVRNLALNIEDEKDHEMKDSNNESDANLIKNTKRRKNRYADELMLSEWLVDIPETLSSDWFFVPCPVGRRCLVVASNGVTSAYSKTGCLLTQFSSFLPGGSRSCSTQFCLLDCIFSKAQRTFYCLDLIGWRGQSVVDTEFQCRIFLMNSWLSENEIFGELTKEYPYRFVCLPYCKCERDSMEEMMQRQFDFELDGILFYYAFGHYHRGSTPLVGWLKAWMLPEILSVSIPQNLQKEDAVTGSSRKFIDEYNTEHKQAIQVPKGD
uniref:Snurportin-1 n=1 Tax=Syphacia muris TaxID=451379 RepID=A0A0N5AKB8_9BILA